MNFIIHPNLKAKFYDLKSIVLNFENTGEVFGDGKRNTIKVIDWDNKKINIKSFKKPHLLNAIVYRFFRKSKARRSFEHAVKLLQLDIGTPTPYAYMENYSWFGGLSNSYYVSQHLECDFTIREVLKSEDFPDGHKILKKFTQFTHQLHESGVLFLDHSPGNTLVKKSASGKYSFYIVDLNRMQFKTLTFEERIRNFSRLTSDKVMIEKLSIFYAPLLNESTEKVFELMWKYTQEFQSGFQRKKALKKRFKISK
ncbi:MAG: lipopolysaccharide kinase InaA family protein [Flavobacterium sp.]